MNQVLVVRNRQRVKRIDARLLKTLATHTLTEILGLETYALGIHLVGAAEMARVNKQFLNHEGSTDVITFEHSPMHGEIFICIDDAVAQAKEFKTSWQMEVVRYAVHGILHLLGHDDLKPAARRKMKVEENRLVRTLAKEFPLAKLAR